MDTASNNNSVQPARAKPNPTFFTRIGGQELYSSEMYRAALTELIASASLLSTVSTIVIACLDSNQTDPKFLVPIGGFVIASLVLIATVPLSGGHLSPVFSFIAALKGVISLVRCLFFVLGQCMGSFISFFIMKTAMDNAKAHKYLLGGCVVNGGNAGVSAGTALTIEFTCTFLVLLYVAITVAFDKKRCMELGLTITCYNISSLCSSKFCLNSNYGASRVRRSWTEPCSVPWSNSVPWRTVVGWTLGILGRAIVFLLGILWLFFDVTKEEIRKK